ncbi:MAG: hypothetical protein IJZ77_03070 [Bacilli bacterium]|nr:hypothetical protein [Bacilli bacterium]
MIATLPLLPSSYENWDWEKSNGNATVEQTKKSYQALINKEYCANFSILVWNDIVDILANALDISGIKWNNKYGTYEDCKIDESVGILTANKFNGVALNAHCLGLYEWKWAKCKNLQGYVGREKFNGVSTHKEQADNLYAWYILELIQKINFLLDVLKNEVDFSELDITETNDSFSSSIYNANGVSLIVAPIKFIQKDILYNKSKLSLPYSLSVCNLNTISTIDNSILVSDPISKLKYENQIIVFNDTSMVSNPTLSFYGKNISESKNASQLNKSKVYSLQENNYSCSSVYAEIEANIRDMISKIYTFSKFIAKQIIAPSLLFNGFILENSFNNSILLSVPSLLAKTKSSIKSNSFSVLSELEGQKLNTFSYLISCGKSILSSKRISPFYYKTPIQTFSNSIINTNFSTPLISNEKICTYIKSSLNNPNVASLNNFDDIFSYTNCSIIDCCTNPLVYMCQSTLHNSSQLTVQKTQGLRIKDNIVSMSNSVCTPSRLNYFNFSNTEVNSIWCVKLTSCESILFTGENHALSVSSACIQKGVPELAYTNSSVNSYSDSMFDIKSGSILRSDIKSKTNQDTILLTKESVTFASNSESESKSYICTEMDLEYKAPDIWYDPIKNENDLYVRSVYYHWKENKTVHLYEKELSEDII